MKIVLFDDTEAYGLRLRAALQKELGSRGQVIWFTPPDNENPEGMYEDRLTLLFKNSPLDKVNLVVADRDLSKTNTFFGLSESTVKRVADSLAIPECAYARGDEKERIFLQANEMREARIVISLKGGDDRLAEQAVSIAQGFTDIGTRLPKANQGSKKKSAGHLLANILEKPEYADKISLYASGDQNRLSEILKTRETKPMEVDQRLTCLLGYWLWDSVLRYPGVVVNEVAASSYLNINETDFKKPEVQELFKDARYTGPFVDAQEPLWWRGMLDDLIANSEASDGLDFARRELDLSIGSSQCCEDPSKEAGYYCMISRKPVSLNNSEAGLSWFPRGADLARICRTSMDKDIPWITG